MILKLQGIYQEDVLSIRYIEYKRCNSESMSSCSLCCATVLHSSSSCNYSRKHVQYRDFLLGRGRGTHMGLFPNSRVNGANIFLLIELIVIHKPYCLFGSLRRVYLMQDVFGYVGRTQAGWYAFFHLGTRHWRWFGLYLCDGDVKILDKGLRLTVIVLLVHSSQHIRHDTNFEDLAFSKIFKNF